MSADAIGLMSAVFLASGVEFVEAFTIVLAMGVARGWRTALTGTVAALLVLGLLTLTLGVTLKNYVNASLLQFIIGTLLLVFGLQWLRKAVLRSAGLKSMHDEEQIFAEELALAQAAGHRQRWGIDGFGFVVSFKGVLLEGLEVVFIVIAVGAAGGTLGPAASGAAVAAVIVVVAAIAVRHPLSRVPENTLKFGVGLMLSSFGVFWIGEGAGIEWPGADLSLLAIGGVFLVV
ncbi:MAG TPA: hypothetical protein VKB27_18140, partial [Gammaproteobacteria bacterium]|nr:hypothetical protein [Gammaproteobacteria bacterium]